jgi:hypothetical protein
VQDAHHSLAISGSDAMAITDKVSSTSHHIISTKAMRQVLKGDHADGAIHSLPDLRDFR